MLELDVYCALSACSHGTVELPVEKWEDIKEWYVKWDRFWYTTEEGEKPEWKDVPLCSDAETEWKRPINVEVWDANQTKLAEREE